MGRTRRNAWHGVWGMRRDGAGRHQAMRAGALVAASVALALSTVPLSGCSTLPNLLFGRGAVVSGSEASGVDDRHVYDRDVTVAEQMEAPDSVMESLRRGEWTYQSDREAVRYAEIAIDHMRDAHGQEVRAQWSSTPWLLSDEAKVSVVAVGGEHDGTGATVSVSAAEGHACTDDWLATIRSDEYGEAIVPVVKEALADFPVGTWAAKGYLTAAGVPDGMADDATVDEMLATCSGSVDVMLSASVVPNEEALASLRTRVLRELRQQDKEAYVWLVVVPDAPGGEQMTMEYGMSRVKDSEELFTTSGVYQRAE